MHLPFCATVLIFIVWDLKKTPKTSKTRSMEDSSDKIDLKLARDGVVAYYVNFKRWLSAEHLPFGPTEQVHGLDQHLRRKAAGTGNSPSDMWNRFDPHNMSLLCQGIDKYHHANLLVTTYMTWWSPQPRDALPAECGTPQRPAHLGQPREFVPWLAGMEDKAFAHAVAWADKTMAEFRARARSESKS